MKITLYTTHCPQCRGVEMQLKAKKLSYEECTDEEKMAELGFKSAPVLVVDDEVLKGKEIYEFLRKVNSN